MNELFRADFKEPRRPSSWFAVLLAVAILAIAAYVWHIGIERLATDFNNFVVDWEEKYDGEKDGHTWIQKTPSGSGMKVILPAPK